MKIRIESVLPFALNLDYTQKRTLFPLLARSMSMCVS